MNKIKSFAIVALLALSLFSCKEDDEIIPEDTFTENGSYFPLIIGNTWIYDDGSDEVNKSDISNLMKQLLTIQLIGPEGAMEVMV